ncbi:hypothetical protein EDB89DRAFT_1980107 [Lactarius sanguifluus]|nr:hypothetical protein EDB89DRAFT_1980107 [Lactarius sanguifluus]
MTHQQDSNRQPPHTNPSHPLRPSAVRSTNHHVSRVSRSLDASAVYGSASDPPSPANPWRRSDERTAGCQTNLANGERKCSFFARKENIKNKVKSRSHKWLTSGDNPKSVELQMLPQRCSTSTTTPTFHVVNICSKIIDGGTCAMCPGHCGHLNERPTRCMSAERAASYSMCALLGGGCH